MNEKLIRNDCVWQDGLILKIDADSDNASPSGTCHVTIASHPRNVVSDEKSFAWNRADIIRPFNAVGGTMDDPRGEKPTVIGDIATECVVPEMLRRAYDSHMTSKGN